VVRCGYVSALHSWGGVPDYSATELRLHSLFALDNDGYLDTFMETTLIFVDKMILETPCHCLSSTKATATMTGVGRHISPLARNGDPVKKLIHITFSDHRDQDISGACHGAE
jgi:hypothetical protein